MKTPSFRLFLPVIAVLSITSCVEPMYSGSGGYSANGNGYNSGYRSGYTANGNDYNSGYRSGYNTYTTLPPNYSGSAYLHNGRYYSGGNYQTGSYYHQGQPYTNRYYHDGQYYYGGNHQNYTDEGIQLNARPY